MPDNNDGVMIGDASVDDGGDCDDADVSPAMAINYIYIYIYIYKICQYMYIYIYIHTHILHGWWLHCTGGGRRKGCENFKALLPLYAREDP
jgi:hypothetical protein